VDRWATFDCYGTLVDWNAGLAGALGDESLLARYHEVEPVVQAESPGLSYREVLRESARRLGVDADPAETLPGWPVFDDVRPELEAARSRGWRLAILSNSDRDLIESSIESTVQFAVPGFVFSHWSGAATGVEPECEVTLDKARKVKAHFVSEAP